MFFNIHSHFKESNAAITLMNVHDRFAQSEAYPYFSIGLHPWYLNTDWQQDFEQMKVYAQKENCLAIGECGLDKAANTNWLLQETVFKAHINLAQQLNKPLIIHCVRAFEEVIFLLEKHKISVPVVFHGFNKSLQIAQRLIAKGCYLSFGASIFSNNKAAILKEISLEKLFFETDNREIEIVSIYKAAAEILETNIELLSLQIQKNWEEVFKLKL